MVVLPGYAIRYQFHCLVLVGGSFWNYQVVSSLQVLIPLNPKWDSGVDLSLCPPVPSRGKRHLTIGELLLQLATGLPPHDLIPDSVEFVERHLHIERVEILRRHAVAQQRYL